MIKRLLKRLLRRTPDYSNGEWHSWYGGPCPVSPGALVQAYIYPKGDQPVLETVFASELDWSHIDIALARFRVLTAQHRPGDVRDTAAAMIPAEED